MERARYSAMRERSVGLGVMGFHSLPAGAEGAVRERHREGVEQAHVQAHPRPGRCRLAPAGRASAGRARTPPNTASWSVSRNKMAIAPTASISIIAGNSSPGHRADRRQRVPAEDAVRQLHRAQPAPAEAAGRARQDTDEVWSSITLHQGQRAAPGFPDRAREGGVQDRVRTGPALGDRARRGPRAVHLPEPVGERFPAGQRAQARPAPDPLAWRGSAA